jgi:GT2 family glycosyltransferase
MSGKSSKISLIIPTHNRTASLQRLLNSLRDYQWLSQLDVEVLVVDNSPDDSRTKDLCNCYDSVKYLYVAQPGQRNALNQGIMAASGDLLAFTDDDVVIASTDWLYRMAKHFLENPNLGYVSGNVKALETSTYAQQIWENHGGLGKGEASVYWSNKELLSNYKLKGWPLLKIIAGANSMIPKAVFDKVGLFNPFFDPGAPVPHGGSHEMGYRIIRAGYDLLYDHEAKVLHEHPKTEKELRKKIFTYCLGDTALHAYFFRKYKDYRSLWSAFGGYQFDLLIKMFKSIIGNYPLPPSYVFAALVGSMYGPALFFNKSICYSSIKTSNRE